MKWNNSNILTECTERELYDLWFSNRKTTTKDISYDDYLKLAIDSSCKVTDRFIVIE